MKPEFWVNSWHLLQERVLGSTSVCLHLLPTWILSWLPSVLHVHRLRNFIQKLFIQDNTWLRHSKFTICVCVCVCVLYLRLIPYCMGQVLVHIFKRGLSYQVNCQQPLFLLFKCWFSLLLLWLWLCFPWRQHGILPFRKPSFVTQVGEPDSWQEGRGLTAGSPAALSQQLAQSLVQTDVSV